MSRTFVDENLLSWEVYASGGRFGLPTEPKIVFHCLSDEKVRPRFVPRGGDEADAEGTVYALSEEELRDLLRGSRELG